MSGRRRPGVVEARRALTAFGLSADLPVERVDSGHINESFRIGGSQPLLLQWLNHHVFADVDCIQRNAERALTRLTAARLPVPHLFETGAERTRRTDSGLWRAYRWLPAHRTLERPDGVATIAACAATLGAVLAELHEMPVAAIETAHAGFHDSDARFAALAAAAAAAPPERSGGTELFEQLEVQHETLGAPMQECAVQVLHGDTKLSNFLLAAPGAASPPVLLDWDTVMVGPLAWDFGDFVRGCCSVGAEDEADRVAVDEALLGAAATAFVGRLPEPLACDPATLQTLARAPAYIAHVLALRFLTDFFDGDRYFRVRDPGHNLRRAETQRRLADRFAGLQGRLLDQLRERCP